MIVVPTAYDGTVSPCPKCGWTVARQWRASSPGKHRYTCKWCEHHWSPTTGTPFAYSNLSYDTLAKGVRLIELGVIKPAVLGRELGITEESAALLVHKATGKPLAPSYERRRARDRERFQKLNAQAIDIAAE